MVDECNPGISNIDDESLLMVRYLLAIFLSLVVCSAHSQVPLHTQSAKVNADEKIGNLDRSKQNTEAVGKEMKEEGSEFWPPLFGYRLKVTDTLLVLFTCLLFVATLYLYLATRDLVKGADKTAQQQLRAYVFVKAIHSNIVANSDIGLVDNWRITVELGNGGNTPTKNLLLNTNWDSFSEQMAGDFDFPDRPYGDAAPGLIGPGGSSHAPHVDIPTALIDQVALKFKHVYIWGWADYDDVVGGPRHRTEFCFEILKDGGLMSFRPHGRFNSSDEECYRAPAAYKK